MAKDENGYLDNPNINTPKRFMRDEDRISMLEREVAELRDIVAGLLRRENVK